ncbi:MAG TPA: hypothetical protein VMT27_06040 [Actinomycetes bacterium]|nr:hypothetical protein [Actinomycetes bacterium]
MTTAAEEAATEAAGMEGWQLYFLGRHGVLGDVDPDVVTASAYVFPPAVVRSEWEAARRLMTPQQALDRYLALCHEWGREKLSEFGGNERLTELAKRIVAEVDIVGLPLFAGWRAVPLPDDVPAQTVHMMQLLREHRGSCHGVALTALGLHPLVAILAGEGGATNAEEYGWKPPFPAVTDEDQALRGSVERLTDDLVTPPYTALSPSEHTELLELLDAAFSHAFG